MPDRVQVRRAAPADLPAIEAIESEAFEGALRLSHRSLARSLLSPRQAVWVATDRQLVVGMVTVWTFKHTWRIYDVAVGHAWRGHDIGSLLLASVEAEAARQGATRLVLEADASRPKLLHWYARHGFTQGTIKRDFYGPGHDAVRLGRRLGVHPGAATPAPHG